MQPTPYQEFVLEKLLNGSNEEREIVISLQPAERQEPIRKYFANLREGYALIGILMEDLMQSGLMVKKDPDNQFLRRTAIRCFAAAVEGIIFCLKQMAHSSGEFAGHTFSEDELFLLTEIQTANKDGKPRRFLPARDNFKVTFNLFAKTFQVPHQPGFGKGFECLCETFKLRDRLMHPKKLSTIEVSDEEKQLCSDAAAWLHTEVQRLLTSCQTSPLGK